MGDGTLVLDDRLYTKDEEWIKKVGENRYQIGITDYAQHELKDINAVEVPKIGEEVKQFQSWGNITSEKGAEELCSPISGKVVATNQENFGDVYEMGEPSPRTVEYIGELSSINEDPYGTWLIEIETKDEGQLEKLLNAEEYKSKIGKKK